MAKALKLKIENSYDFILIGLVTSEPIYRLGWLLNQELGLQLADSKSVQLLHKQTKIIQSFSRFEYIDNDEVCYELIYNRSSNGLFIEEQKSMDYFLKISESNLIAEELLSLIKAIENISLAIEIVPGSLKSKNRLISYTIEKE